MTKLKGCLLVGDVVHTKDGRSFDIVARVNDHELAGVCRKHQSTRLFNSDGTTSSSVDMWKVTQHVPNLNELAN